MIQVLLMIAGSVLAIVNVVFIVLWCEEIWSARNMNDRFASITFAFTMVPVMVSVGLIAGTLIMGGYSNTWSLGYFAIACSSVAMIGQLVHKRIMQNFLGGHILVALLNNALICGLLLGAGIAHLT